MENTCGNCPVFCDASDIESTLNSNHSLTSVATSRASRVPRELSKLLDMNNGTDKKFTAQLKVLRCHFNGNFDLTAVAGLDAKALPNLLTWFGRLMNSSKSADLEDEQTCLSALRRIIIHNPGICRFPGYERTARLKAENRVATLEHELDDEKSLVEKLRHEVNNANSRIAVLEREVEELRSNKRHRGRDLPL